MGILKHDVYLMHCHAPLQISMPALKEHIYGSRSVTAEAKHSIMHALFLIIGSKPSKCSENLQQGLKIFNRLFDEYFKATMEVSREGVATVLSLS